MFKHLHLPFTVLILVMSSAAFCINIEQAVSIFREVDESSRKDGGRLWGISLAGPILLVDPQTREVVSNRNDMEGSLKQQGSVFVGLLPKDLNIANTAISWAGVKWTMVIWPLPSDQKQRASLLFHELFHRVQDDLGFPAANPANSHLDSANGRIWLRLELRALRKAIRSDGKERKQAITDALLFREYRRTLYPSALQEEISLEMNEGLAEYTGIRLSGGSPEELADQELKAADEKESLVRSFAYATGPAYGLLLDGSAPNWRQDLKPETDLGVLLRKSFAIPVVDSVEAKKRSAAYDGKQLIAAEMDREHVRQQRIAAYRKKFIEGPRLVIPIRQMSVQFNPDNLQPLEDAGTVYPTIRVTDQWGILTAENGALVNFTWTEIIVPAPTDLNASPLQGDGWQLNLKDGWILCPEVREGDYTLKKKDSEFGSCS